MALYLGFDSSTQSLKATAVRAADLQVALELNDLGSYVDPQKYVDLD